MSRLSLAIREHDPDVAWRFSNFQHDLLLEFFKGAYLEHDKRL